MNFSPLQYNPFLHMDRKLWSADSHLLCDSKPASHEIKDLNKKEWHAPKFVSGKEHQRGSRNKRGRHVKFYSLFSDNSLQSKLSFGVVPKSYQLRGTLEQHW